MLSAFELKMAHRIKWTARVLVSTYAIGLAAFAIHSVAAGDTGDWGETVRWFASMCVVILAFLSIWKFEIIGGVLIGFATLWLNYGLLCDLNLPEYFYLALLIPGFLSIYAWMRNVEHRVEMRYQRN